MDLQTRPVQIGGLLIDPATNTISWQHNSVKMTPKVMETFLVLAAANEEVISRDELLNTVWPGRVGADESLTRAISDIRKALKSLHPDAAKALVTVPKHGYQFKTSVVRQIFEGECEQNITEKAASTRVSVSRVAVVVFTLLLVFIGATALLVNNDTKEIKPVIAVLPFVPLGNEAQTGFLG